MRLRLLALMSLFVAGCSGGGGGGGGTGSSVPAGTVPVAFVTSTLPDGVATAAYSAVVTGEEGSRTGYRWSVAAGTFPQGLTLNAAGTPSTAISGVPTAAGSYSFTLRLEDDYGFRATRSRPTAARSRGSATRRWTTASTCSWPT